MINISFAFCFLQAVRNSVGDQQWLVTLSATSGFSAFQDTTSYRARTGSQAVISTSETAKEYGDMLSDIAKKLCTKLGTE